MEETNVEFEARIARLEEMLNANAGELERVTATLDNPLEALESRLAEAERQIAQLQVTLQAAATTATPVANGRRTLPASAANLLAKHGVATDTQLESGAIDSALVSLPIEQRIAVKSQLLRAGLLG